MVYCTVGLHCCHYWLLQNRLVYRLIMSFASSAAENLITILQARDGLTVKSPPVRGPECCSYNSHGSSIQESPSERESQIYCLSLSYHSCLYMT